MSPRTVAAVRALRVRRRALEERVERRYPRVYDARHAATGITRALWPLIGPLLAAVILVPIVALLAALWALLGLALPTVSLPSVSLPSVPLPHIIAPGWLRAVGRVIDAVLSVLGPVLHWVFIASIVVGGLLRTRKVRKRREAAEAIGRTELARRLACGLARIAISAEARGVQRVGALLDDGDPEEGDASIEADPGGAPGACGWPRRGLTRRGTSSSRSIGVAPRVTADG